MIENLHERVKDLLQIGEKSGFTPQQWAILLIVSAEVLQKKYDFTVQATTVEQASECPCPKCVEIREGLRRQKLSIVKPEPEQGVQS